MSDLPGPEKPLTFNWGAVVADSVSPPTAPKALVGRIKKVRPRQRIAIMLAESGWKQKDICKALGYTPSRLSIILNSSNKVLNEVRVQFASEVADNIKDVHSRLKLYANEMLDKLVLHARQDAKPELSRLAARDLLHMAGFTPVKKHLMMEARVPFEELVAVAKKIEEANEVVMRRGEWEVREMVKTA